MGGRIAVALSQSLGCKVRLGSRTVRQIPIEIPEAEAVVINVRDPGSLSAAMKDVHAVIHLAAMNENDCAVNPNLAVQINTLGTLNTLQAAIAEGVNRFIYFSTAHVYGAPLLGNISEKTLPKPCHPYAITHRAAEDFILAEHTQKTIEGIVVRLSNGFGQPMHPGVDRWTLLVNDLCRQAVCDRRLVLRSSGLQQRDFITLTDIVRATEHLFSLSRKAITDGLFNLGGEASISVWEMTQLIAKRCNTVLGFFPDIVRPESVHGNNSQNLIYQMEKLKNTGFRLVGNRNEEIDRTLIFCRNHFDSRR